MSDERGTETPVFVEATREDNPVLWALQQYQKVVRRWMGSLTLIEFAVLMQIVDRTVGWQRTERVIGVPGILDGGRLYTGVGHAVKKAAVMSALRSLEDKGIIERRRTDRHPQYKEYVINLRWSPPPRTERRDLSDIDEDDFCMSLHELQRGGSTT